MIVPKIFANRVSDIPLVDLDTNFSFVTQPEGMDSYSDTVTEMKLNTDPYPGGVESLPTTLSGEIERLRYLIKLITGKAQWYIHPDGSGLSFVSAVDTTPNYLASKIIAGANISITPSGAGNETLTISSSLAFPGVELLWPTEAVPAGWLEEDGSSLLIASYPTLYAVIGKTFGSADVSHFNLPDMRGFFPRIWAHGSTNDPDKATRTKSGKSGAEGKAGDHVGSEQPYANSSHYHTITGHMDLLATAAIDMDHYVLSNYNEGNLGTSYSGGNEARPLNQYRMLIIKY